MQQNDDQVGVVFAATWVDKRSWFDRSGLRCWLTNLKTAHHRVMMRYLQKRGWVVFYLNERSRCCGVTPAKGTCWLALYEQGRKK